MAETSAVGEDLAACALVNAISLGMVIANIADRCVVLGDPVEAMTLDPNCCLCVSDRLDLHTGHDS